MTTEEIQRRYATLQNKKENLLSQINLLREKLSHTKSKLKETNIRCDKIERYLYPKQKRNQIKAEKFRILAKKVLPKKLFNDLWLEATGENITYKEDL